MSPEITYIKVLVDSDNGSDRMDTKYYNVSYYWQITHAEDTSLEGLHTLHLSLLNLDGHVTVGTDEYIR